MNIKKTFISIFKSMGLIFLLLYFTSIVTILFNVDVSSMGNKSKILYMLMCNLIFLFGLLYLYKDTIIRDAKSFFKNFSKNIDVSLKYWVSGFLIMIVSNLILTYVLKKPLAGNEEKVRELIDMFPLYMIFQTLIYAPFTEELIFRKSIFDIGLSKWVYALMSGLIFGLLHIISYISTPTDLLYLIPYSSLGIAFALLYKKTDNIFSSISMHFLHNSLSVIVYLLGKLLWRSL